MKFALVTGASRGIGKAIALKLAGDGFFILLNYNTNKAAAESALHEIQAYGGQAELLPFDVSDNSQVETVLEAWKANHPDSYIEVLVNNAGIRDDGLMVFMPVDQWERIISTNLNSFFYVTRQVLQPMLIRKQGRIINIVSLSGQKGQPGQTNYSAAKAGIIGASKSLAMEIGKKKVTVNCVSPGFIETDMTKDLDTELLKKLVPLNQFGTAADVAEVVGFLASPKSKYITGEVISVNGGIYS
ncbi:MAG: 3-oxoacyl-ACP reductase FabG [Bacteroidota bacterium]